VIQAFYSIRWAHYVISVISPTESFLVKNILEGAKRRLCVPTVKKDPVTPELLPKMYDSLFSANNVYNQRTICACLLAYAGFMRISELLNLRICDINFSQEYISVFIEKSKTDVYRDGNWLIICRTGSPLCPVRNLELYLEWLGCCQNSECYLFQNLVKVQQGYIFRQINKPLSYSRMRELFIEAFSPFVVNIKSYGLHSLRSGGATSAAKDGVPDRLFKRHGRWRSDKSKDGYVKDV
jgi:integrase